MKKKEIKELHSKSTTELKELVRKTRVELVKLRLEQGAGKLKNTHLVSQKRHHLARLKTILKNKELA